MPVLELTPVQELLDQATKIYSPGQIALELGKAESTVHRWMKHEVRTPELARDRLEKLVERNLRAEPPTGDFRFIDLFAGIGGLRTAFSRVGGQCVFTSEWDDYAQRTYLTNYHTPFAEMNGDITKVDEKSIPAHDVLLAGFPCQPFSIAGVSKKNALGRVHGFLDETQGTLFFDVARIIKEKQPKAFLLENVKNLKSHDKGQTFQVIMNVLEQELGYHVQTRIIDGQHWVPQHRERIVIVGFRDWTPFDLSSLKLPTPHKKPVLGDILHKTDGTEPVVLHDGDKYFDHDRRRVQPRYTLTAHLWTYLQNYAEKHRTAGNGFGFGLVNRNSVTRTLSARYYKDGSEILVDQSDLGLTIPRRLTPRECARLMGYPDSFQIPVSDTRAYKQFGNSVVVPVFETVAKAMKPYLGL